MFTFIAKHILEIVFGLISAGALAFCRYMFKQVKGYKKLLAEKEEFILNQNIDSQIKPIWDKL